MTDDQPRDKIGQFASTTHAEASVSLSAQPAFDVEAHAELTAAIRAETFCIDESKRKLSKMQLDAALSVVRKEFPEAAELELTFSSSFGMNPKAVRDKNGNVLSEGTSWTYSAPEGASSVVSHLDQTSQSLFYNGEDGFRYEDETGALLVDVNHRFSPAPAEPELTSGFDRSDRTPAAEMSPEQARTWIAGQALHHLSPVVGFMHLDAEDGKDTTVHNKSFEERIERLADDVAERFATVPQDPQGRADATNVASEAIWKNIKPVFDDVATASGDDSRLTATRWRMAAESAADEISKKVTGPAPVLDGFTAAEVEDYLAREQHERQCACDLPGDVCRTDSYGEHWRHRLGVPDVEGIFDSIQEMAAARDAGKQTA